ATSSNFSTSAYGNYRIGGTAATTTGGAGDLTLGSTPYAVVAQGSVGASAITGNTLTVNGAYGSVPIPYPKGASAKDMAALVNAQTEKTGVSASARTEIGLSGMVAASSYNLQIASDNGTGQAVTLSFTIGTQLNSDGLGDAAKAFNDAAAKTGVTARVNDAGTGLVLTNAAGNDIKLVNNSTTGANLAVTQTDPLATAVAGTSALAEVVPAANNFGTDDLVVTGQLTLDSSKSFSAMDAAGAASGGFLNISTAAGSQVQTVQNMDVSTVDGANRTLAIVDSALSAISGQRANYGALQARFESAIANLNTSSENMSAARSRILDADFA
ncbi:flagellin hook IN motif-containing protein, partial [Acidovorax sp. SRB_24]|uniref:flagellin hook IN motif-containing protein n=1 Tax=Acidovorax sp. SRB_24 TaxID=1962700 RepID=UPI001EBD4225